MPFDEPIQMVDLQTQYLRLKKEINRNIQETLHSGRFINGSFVGQFAEHFAEYMQTPHVIPCANGTDALQIALMALNLQHGDEVIVPAFNYVAAAEVAALLGLEPVFVDVDPATFNIDPAKIEQAISRNTRAIIPVHLFGQACDMDAVMRIAAKYNLYVIEDNAQSVGAVYTGASGDKQMAGTVGHIGTTSFFPTKPLACYGDGGALMTSDDALAERLRLIANHGQQEKYHHKVIGCNSRLDTIQAAVLDVKLQHLASFTQSRTAVAKRYNTEFQFLPGLTIPQKAPYSTHVYHQYTIRVKDGRRDELQAYLQEQGIPTMVYYPLPLDKQEAFRMHSRKVDNLAVSAELSQSVLSLPIHTEMKENVQAYIIDQVKRFFRK